MANLVIITIEGPNFQDFEEADFQRLPTEGEPIETKYGTCLVTRTELLAQDDRFAARE